MTNDTSGNGAQKIVDQPWGMRCDDDHVSTDFGGQLKDLRRRMALAHHNFGRLAKLLFSRNLFQPSGSGR